MHKVLFLLLTAALFPAASVYGQSQENKRRFELFVGYSYLMTDLDDPDAPLDRFDNLDGVNISVTGYLTKRFGLTGDFSAHFRNRTEAIPGGTVDFKGRSFNYLAGPQFKFLNQTRVTPFVHFLAGAANNRFSYRATATGATTPAVNVSAKVTDFSLAMGGGLDVRLSKRLSLRAFQIEYNPVFVRSRPAIGINGDRRLDNVRFSMGIVIR